MLMNPDVALLYEGQEGEREDPIQRSGKQADWHEQ